MNAEPNAQYADPIGQAAVAGKLLVTAAEAARSLSICPRTLWSLTAAGEIPAIKIGTSVRYDPRDLVAWIDSKKTRAANGQAADKQSAVSPPPHE